MPYDYNMTAGRYEGEHLGVRYVLKDDTDPDNPRNWDNAATMACKHGRYNLGDEDGTADLTHAIRSSAYYRDNWENDGSDWENSRYARHYKGDASEPSGIAKMLPRCRDIIYLPLYLYDHSGITMSTGQFSCQWDSGQVGFIFMTLAKAIETFPNIAAKFKKPMVSPGLRKAVLALMEAEVKVYDQYLRNDVYGYSIPGTDEMGSEVWGYYGDESASEAAEEYIDSLSEEDRAAIIAAQAEDHGDEEEADH